MTDDEHARSRLNYVGLSVALLSRRLSPLVDPLHRLDARPRERDQGRPSRAQNLVAT